MNCSLCGREGDDKYFEVHHLTPQDKKSNTIDVCHQCGDQLHLMFDNHALKRDLNTRETILQNEMFKKYVKWVRKQPIETHISAKKKKRKR